MSIRAPSCLLQFAAGVEELFMIGLQLMRLIEQRSEELARGLTIKLRDCERTSDFRKIPVAELHRATVELYRNLGEWLLNKSEAEIEERFRLLAARRAGEGIGLHQLVWALRTSRNHLWQFLRSHAFADNVVALYGEMELQQVLNQFFDRAIYYGVLGYQEAGEQQPVRAHIRSARG